MFKSTYFEEHLRRTASVISKFTVNNPTTDISYVNLQDFVRLFWMAASKVIAIYKNMFSVSIEVTIIALMMSF